MKAKGKNQNKKNRKDIEKYKWRRTLRENSLQHCLVKGYFSPVIDIRHINASKS